MVSANAPADQFKRGFHAPADGKAAKGNGCSVIAFPNLAADPNPLPVRRLEAFAKGRKRARQFPLAANFKRVVWHRKFLADRVGAGQIDHGTKKEHLPIDVKMNTAFIKRPVFTSYLLIRTLVIGVSPTPAER